MLKSQVIEAISNGKNSKNEFTRDDVRLEQLARLFESGGLVSVENMPVRGNTMDELDMRRLREYFQQILDEDEIADWRRKLLYRDLLVKVNGDEETVCCSYPAYALFALQPELRLPQAGLRGPTLI